MRWLWYTDIYKRDADDMAVSFLSSSLLRRVKI